MVSAATSVLCDIQSIEKWIQIEVLFTPNADEQSPYLQKIIENDI